MFKQEEKSFTIFKSVYYASLYFNNKIDEIINSINRCDKFHDIDYLFKAVYSITNKDYSKLKKIKEECEIKLQHDNIYNYNVLVYLYDYFYENKYSKREYMIFASEYKKNNKYISDMLLNLIN